MRKLKLFGVAFALAGAAFVFTMVKNPPQSVASDPTAPATKTVEIQVPTGILAWDCMISSVCP